MGVCTSYIDCRTAAYTLMARKSPSAHAVEHYSDGQNFFTAKEAKEIAEMEKMNPNGFEISFCKHDPPPTI